MTNEESQDCRRREGMEGRAYVPGRGLRRSAETWKHYTTMREGKGDDAKLAS